MAIKKMVYDIPVSDKLVGDPHDNPPGHGWQNLRRIYPTGDAAALYATDRDGAVAVEAATIKQRRPAHLGRTSARLSADDRRAAGGRAEKP